MGNAPLRPFFLSLRRRASDDTSTKLRRRVVEPPSIRRRSLGPSTHVRIRVIPYINIDVLENFHTDLDNCPLIRNFVACIPKRVHANIFYLLSRQSNHHLEKA